MIKGRDIIIVGLQPWDIPIGSNCKNIATELSKHNRVLYVNPPLDRSTYLKGQKQEAVQRRIEVIKGKSEGLVKIKDGLWNLYPSRLAESINWIGASGIFHWLNKINNRRLANDILSAMNFLNMKDVILFNDQSMVRCFHLKEMLQPDFFIYYIRDNLSSIPYFRKHALAMEHQLIAEADVVATNSEFLAEYARKYNPDSKFVGQGCDFGLYKDVPNIQVANELLHLPRPIIGYTGFLTAVRLDIQLLIHLAKSNNDWQLVLVGPEDDAFKQSELHQLKNVHFLGNKSPDSLPGFMKAFDVAINPQLVNEVTVGNYPRKIDEYLAMGKPVVATNTPFMEYFKSHTYLANSKEEFAELTAIALREDSNEKADNRIRYALTHTWEANVEAISDLAEQKMKLNVETPI